ncbi:MAG TPA: hypothetical protein ENJ96_02060, partial [Thermodesulfatator atlanticus]|nr:hypothetical protein [Thermodesulfatator atlanticus]
MKAQAPKEKKDAVELRGRPQEDVLNEIQALVPKNETRWLSFSFSPLARGEIEIKNTKRGLRGDGFLPLRNPALPTRDLGLHLRVRSRRITGSLAFRAGKGYLDFHRLNSILKRHPLALGIKGVEVISRPKIKNRLTSQGELEFSATNVKLKIQKAFLGSLDLSLTDQGPRVTRAQARLDFKKIAKVEMELLPRKDGYLTGKVQTDVTLGKAAGKGEFVWDEKGLQAGGELGYQDEKFDGKVRLKVASADRAKALLADKVPRWRPLHQPYAVFAEGTLTFHFTDWLTGSAQVIIDPWGHFTVCGEITPQAEIELFAQKDFRRELPPLEARASYGIPVIGNVFLFIGLGLELWATVGPAKFYNIKVSGQYSTDPEVAKDFRIQGSLNISAAAGIDARIEGGAGVEIADHDVKAGVGLTGRAGIKGYAEATPIVGYREQPETGKGEFFISGELEIGAQPFLGLSGDFFIEVDSPWWSPLGDKEWRWPFLNKEWPLPGTFAVKAKVDYVFGSGKWPE